MQYPVNEQWNLIEDKHHENFHDAGLTANTPIIPTDAQWVTTLGEVLVQKFTLNLQEEWLKRFCQSFNKATLEAENIDEQAHRCGYQVAGVVPEILNQYYLEKWKISFNDYNTLLATVMIK